MIRRLRLHGWRAFDEVTLELAEGLTFVVAENGVGKTSLVQAAAWALYGPTSTVDARAARRIGAPDTFVDVDLELPDGRLLAITRTVSDRSEEVRARLAGADLDDDGLDRVLADSFGASRDFLSLTTVLPSGSVADDTAGAFHLQAHLRRVFGVDNLQQAAEQLERLRDTAAADARELRQASRRAVADRTRLATELAEATAAEATAESGRAAARSVLALAEAQLQAARAAQAGRAAALAAQAEFDQVLAAATQLLGRRGRLAGVGQPADLASRLDAAEAAAVEALDRSRREAAALAGRLDALQVTALALNSAGHECPVCRRDLSPDDIGRAADAHTTDITTLLAQQRAVGVRVTEAARHLDAVRALSRQAHRLPDLVAPPSPRGTAAGGPSFVDSGPAAGAGADPTGPALEPATIAAQAARADTDRADELAALTRARRIGVEQRLAEEEQAARVTDAALAAHRREAATSVAAEVMRATADAILADRIDPLTAEVSHRWKRVFGERGALRLRSDGRLVLVRGVHEIPFSQFSSGEKVVALLATRLLVLGASTRASFLWLDEPLEHLDPRNRRVVASLMTAAGPHVRQVVVTTYEEALARRLAAAASAHVRYVRTPEA